MILLFSYAETQKKEEEHVSLSWSNEAARVTIDVSDEACNILR